MMGIMVPETCWASNKICNKYSSVASSWHFISTYYRRYTVKTTSNLKRKLSVKEESACSKCAVSWSCASSPSKSTRNAAQVCWKSQHLVQIIFWKDLNISHTKLLQWILFLTMTKSDNFSSQPGQQENMKFFSTYCFRTSAFIQMGPWVNGMCSFGGWNLLRTFVERVGTEGKSLLWLPCPATA